MRGEGLMRNKWNWLQIKKLREKYGMTQSEFAKMLGISDRLLRSFELRQKPVTNTYDALFDSFNREEITIDLEMDDFRTFIKIIDYAEYFFKSILKNERLVNETERTREILFDYYWKR